MASKLLGGVDQASLRQSLSSRDNLAMSTDYLSDAEVWTFSNQLRDMEGLQLDIVSSDIQVCVIDMEGLQLVSSDIQVCVCV